MSKSIIEFTQFLNKIKPINTTFNLPNERTEHSTRYEKFIKYRDANLKDMWKSIHATKSDLPVDSPSNYFQYHLLRKEVAESYITNTIPEHDHIKDYDLNGTLEYNM